MAPAVTTPLAAILPGDGEITEGKSPRSGLSPLVATIKELHRRRQDFLNAEGSLARQSKAIERRMQATALPSTMTASSASAPLNGGHAAGDTLPKIASGSEDHDTDVNQFGGVLAATFQLRAAQRYLKRERTRIERELQKLAMTHPAYATFVEPICGFGALGFAQIIGEAGDLSIYANPAKLWKRFGLGLVDGIRQQRFSDPALALAHGYSTRRRSVMFVIGDSLLKKQNAYKELYNLRKAYEIEKAKAAGLEVRPAKVGDPRDQDAHGFRSLMKIHRRSQRYVEKRLLRDLWRAWRAA